MPRMTSQKDVQYGSQKKDILTDMSALNDFNLKQSELSREKLNSHNIVRNM